MEQKQETIAIKPMLAMKKHKLKSFQFPAAMELKYDGIRAIVAKIHGNVFIHTREGADYTSRYKSLAHELQKLPIGMYDGEIYFPRYPGAPSAQAEENERDVKFAIFDLPLIKKTWAERRFILMGILPPSSRFHISQVLSFKVNSINEIKPVLNKVLNDRQEGIILKPWSSHYHPGKRTEWVKLKREIDDMYFM